MRRCRGNAESIPVKSLAREPVVSPDLVVYHGNKTAQGEEEQLVAMVVVMIDLLEAPVVLRP